MNEEKAPQEDSQAKPRAKTETASSQPAPTPRDSPGPSNASGWAGAPTTSQVVRTVAAALLTVVVLLVALFLLWQVRTFVGWLVIGLFLAAVLNPAVNWRSCRILVPLRVSPP
jgi:hypothetical protein